jgi:adenine-specific DNA-methyltransferase
MSEPEKLDLRSMDIAKEQKEKLRQLFPEIFTEDKIDFEKLKLTVGESIEAGKERYGMNWPGKADCFKIIQNPSIGTLKPCPEESVNFDKTENLFIEGDNLEVLKLLQKSYYGKIKMIYIDPPYNTGNDFIYPDDYTENLTTYLQYTGQVDAEGKKFSTNADTEGRFHTKWINMMYSRLFLAKNLLRDDGVIFASIDDNEVHNLRDIMNEIFGEENFIGCFTINTTPNARDYGHIGKMHEYCLFYAKNMSFTETYLVEDKEKTFRYKDSTGEFNVHPLYNSNEAFSNDNRPNLFYPFYLLPTKKIEEIGDNFYEISLEKTNDAIEIYPPLSQKNKVQFVWRWGKEKAQDELNKEIVGYKTEDGEYRIVQKMRTTSKLIRSLIDGVEFTTRRGTAELEKIFNKKIVEFPKPVELIKYFLKAGVNTDSIVVDFFAGSATTAQAVLDLNKEDGGNRKFIMVQLPEKCEEKSEAFKAGYKTLTDIGKERIRRVINNIEKEKGETLFKDKQLDLGFKVFKLDKSNFKIWDAEKVSADKQALEKQLELHIDHIDPKATQEEILFEILLKTGFELTTKIEKIELAGKIVYSIEDGAMLVCLEKELTKGVIKAMAEKQPSRVICLDQGFVNNDQLKTNAVQIMKTKGVDDFRTV